MVYKMRKWIKKKVPAKRSLSLFTRRRSQLKPTSEQDTNHLHDQFKRISIRGIKTIYSEKESDYNQFVLIADYIAHCSFLVELNVPNIVKEIAEFATGKVAACEMCEIELHFLLSDSRDGQRILCKRCFRRASRDHKKLTRDLEQQFGF